MINQNSEGKTRKNCCIHALLKKQAKRRLDRGPRFLCYVNGRKWKNVIIIDEAWMYLTDINGIRKIYYNFRGERANFWKEPYPKGVMFVADVCYRAKKRDLLCQARSKNQQSVLHPFRSHFSTESYIRKLFPGELIEKVVFHHDSAPAHSSGIIQEWLRNSGIKFIPKEHWMGNSPDLAPMNFCVNRLFKWELLDHAATTVAGSDDRRYYRAVLVYLTDGRTQLNVSPSSQGGWSANEKPFICKAEHSGRPLCKVEEGWDYFEDRCWRHLPRLENFIGAQAVCRYLGGYVAVPSSATKNERLQKLADDFDVDSVWMGLFVVKTPTTTTQTVVWEDKSSVIGSSYTVPWGASFANIFDKLPLGNIYCGSTLRGYQYGKWLLEANCNDQKPFWCESGREICPYGWTQFSGMCYQFRLASEDIKAYREAGIYCSGQGGSLAVVYNADVQQFLETKIAMIGMPSDRLPNFWIGLSSPGTNGIFEWNSAAGVTPTDYVNWLGGVVPNNPLRSCVYMQGDQIYATAPWVAGECSEPLGHICQALPETAAQPEINIPQFKCDPPFVRYHDGCFYAVPTPTNWDLAKADCQQRNSDLVEIETSGENAFITGAITLEPEEIFDPACGEGWKAVGIEYCYKFMEEDANQELASQICENQSEDSSLLYLENSIEARMLRDLMNTGITMSTDTFWIGLQVLRSDQWHWQYRNATAKWIKPMAYTNWGPNQPQAAFQTAAAGRILCAYLLADQTMRWEASSCEMTRSFICKKRRLDAESPIILPLGPPPTNYTYGCPAGWTKFNENCFQRNENYLNWTEARDGCKSVSAELAHVYSEAHHQSILHLLNGAWIGLNSLGQPMNPREFVYENGRPVRYTPWLFQVSRPDAPLSSRDTNCVAALGLDPAQLDQSLTLGQYSCGEVRPFVCLMPLQAIEIDPATCIKPPQDHGCQRWGHGHKGACFYMGQDPASPLGMREEFSFDNAQRFCGTYYNGDLGVFNSRDQLDFLSILLTTWASDYWIGLRENGNTWQSISTWVNDDAVAVANWAYNEPSRAFNGRGCIAVHGTRSDHFLPGQWYVADCSSQKFALCEGSRSDWTDLPEVPTPFPSGCPKDWTTPDANSRNCYKEFYAASTSPGVNASSNSVPKLTWREAENACADFSGHLASISSKAEQDHVNSILRIRPQHYNYWIGLYEDGTSWKWSDGTPFLGTNFFNPTIDSSSEQAHDCVGIYTTDGTWLKQNCEVTWGWVCEIPKGFYLEGQQIPTLPTPAAANASCGLAGSGDWFYNPLTDSCFFLSHNPMTWDGAEQTCNFLESHLATVTKDDHPFLTKLISRYSMPYTEYWIGLRLTDPNLLTHHWIDGTFENVFRPWDHNEPNPQGVQACVKMSNLHGFWLDDYCQRPGGYRFICQKSKAPMVPATTAAPEIVETWGCPSTCRNCVRFRDSCYFVSPREIRVTWDEARNACRAINPNPTDRGGYSDLVSIHDKLENDFLFAQMGLHDRQDRWLGLHEDRDRQTMFWSDQTRFDFNFWEPREPQLHSVPECVIISAGVLLGVDASVTAPVVEPDRRCDPNFEYISGVCFAVFATPTLTAPINACQSIQPGSRLAAVTNLHENVFVRLLLAQLKHNIPTADVRALLGGRRADNGRLSWNSECYPSYNNIRRFYTDPGKNDSCVYMQYNGEWATQSCTDRTHQFIVCEKRQVECSKLITLNDGTCPDGFNDPCHDYCYRISHSSSGSSGAVPVLIGFEYAKSTCTSFGGSLVSIRNEHDQKCIGKYIESATSNLWLGLFEASGNVNGNLTWTWLDGSVANYENWNPGEPNNMQVAGLYREACTEILPNGFWNNVPCYGNRGYICEKPKIPLSNGTCGPSDAGNWAYDSSTDNCFFISDNVANWTEAENFCNTMDSHLATIEQADQAFVMKTLLFYTPISTLSWIGLRLVNPTNLTHSWIDGNLASIHRAWDVNEPNPMGVQACVVMVTGSGKWRDDYCQRSPGYQFICRKAKASIIPPATVPPYLAETWGCPVECKNCTRFRDSCYYISPSPKADAMTWDEARNACRAIYQHPTDMSKSSELVSIHDQLEQDFIFSQMGIDTPECVHIFGEKMYGDGRWNDLNCDARAGYVCKMKKDSEYPAPVQHPDTRCDPHFQFLNGACFAVFQMPEQTDPDEACDSMQRGSRLATITSIYENVFIRLLLAKIKDDVPVSQVRALLGGQLSHNGRLSWKSGCYPSFNNIANFFSDQDQTDRCVSMQYDGKWVVHPCWDTSKECSKLITTNDGTCPSGFEDECHDYCYHITHSSSSGQGKGEEAMFEVAKTKCSEMGGSLVSIRSEEDQKCIAKYVESMEGTLWLGLYETTGNTNGTVNWKWLDDDFVDEGNYRNWGKGEPSHLYLTGPTREACTEMTFDGFWNNVPCSLTKRGYLSPRNRPHTPYLDRVSPGTLIGLAVTVLLLIPALTVGAFIIWKRKTIPLSSWSGRSASYQNETADDQVPVVEAHDETYT
ncbi:C-type mannose receptor 2 [Hypsibius exemplaris]|uniref:C-type mannose receptor 2 n=1 Tax=Hypsibius exemplaris TaxID=2072580 RepID=A0A1W0W9S5_HYPEX|nr:C-type mannose receptor 2 [Hypsibius exemplaris]